MSRELCASDKKTINIDIVVIYSSETSGCNSRAPLKAEKRPGVQGAGRNLCIKARPPSRGDDTRRLKQPSALHLPRGGADTTRATFRVGRGMLDAGVREAIIY